MGTATILQLQFPPRKAWLVDVQDNTPSDITLCDDTTAQHALMTYTGYLSGHKHIDVKVHDIARG